ncbi:uncharacterized protein LOC109703761 [Ananas comosus]|uniref:Uncharacterized protein LOC109703761 n=1 Tax=Ananas comosus TaxID=4615 RepID=A0A6P5EEY3_ANACO|nr:uncharacterized protein LOC109703761 [Ananas comosus]
MTEYERDFSHIVELIPFVVHDEYHKAPLFARGLRPSIRLLIASHGMLTFDERLDRALMVQSDMDEARIEQDASEKSEDRKRAQESFVGGQSSNGRPPKHRKTQSGSSNAPATSQRQSTRPCVICGKAHKVNECPQRHNHCYKCGQRGHLQADCINGVGTVSTVVSTPAAPWQDCGNTAYSLSGRPSTSRQEKGAH